MATTETPAGKMRSVEALRAIPSVSGITKTERIVLTVLAEHAGAGEKTLECYPSIQTIAAKAHCSVRHATRVVGSLRKKGVISFDDNTGGKHKSNRYLLLFANPDKSQTLTKRNPDILNANPDKSNTQTLTNRTPNPDTAMSEEWFEGFNEWLEWKIYPPLFQSEEDFSSEPSRFRNYLDVREAAENFDLEDLLRKIIKGTSIDGNWKCDNHGTFRRPGFRFGNWIAWIGHESMYSSTWTDDAGCHGCRLRHQEAWGDKPKPPTLPIRQFDLKTPATCPDHGHFMFLAQLSEYGEEWARVMGKRLRLEVEHDIGCPGCEAEFIYEQQVQEELGLTNEEWERGGKQIIAAIDYAREKPSEHPTVDFVDVSAVKNLKPEVDPNGVLFSELAEVR